MRGIEHIGKIRGRYGLLIPIEANEDYVRNPVIISVGSRRYATFTGSADAWLHIYDIDEPFEGDIYIDTLVAGDNGTVFSEGGKMTSGKISVLGYLSNLVETPRHESFRLLWQERQNEKPERYFNVELVDVKQLTSRVDYVVSDGTFLTHVPSNLEACETVLGLPQGWDVLFIFASELDLITGSQTTALTIPDGLKTTHDLLRLIKRIEIFWQFTGFKNAQPHTQGAYNRFWLGVYAPS